MRLARRDTFGAPLALLSLLSGYRTAAAFHQYVPRLEPHDCPVRIHSNRVHSGVDPAAGPQQDPEDQPAAPPANGRILQPWPNNTGILASAYYRPGEFLKSKCQFIFLGAIDEHVQIVFQKFSLPMLEESPQVSNGSAPAQELRCEEEDHVTAHVLVGPRMSKIHDFCGDEIPPQLMSAKNLLTLNYVIRNGGGGRRRLRTDRPGDSQYDGEDEESHGFVLEYRFIRDYGRQPAEAVPIDNTSCSFAFNGSVKTSGDLWSPNYPGFYPRNLDCQYVFHGHDDQIVLISFEYFDVEGFAACEEKTQSDFVLFSNYKTMDRTNRRYCGGTRPPKAAIASESNYFRMQFRTNEIFDGTGFYAHYQFYDQQLSQQNRIRLITNAAGGTLLNQFSTSAIISFLIGLNIIFCNFPNLLY